MPKKKKLICIYLYFKMDKNGKNIWVCMLKHMSLIKEVIFKNLELIILVSREYGMENYCY